MASQAEADPAQEARDALIAAGIEVRAVGDELERWQVGKLVFSDADLWRLAASRGLVGNVNERPPQLSRRERIALRALCAAPGGLRGTAIPRFESWRTSQASAKS